MKKLDNKDYLLLDLLGAGSRKSLGRIAQELQMHKNSVLYRIKRLRRLGAIERFSFIPGIAALGKNTFYVFFRLKLREKEREEVYSYFKVHPLALWVLRLSGKWNLMAEFICDDINRFNDELAKITDFLGERLSDYTTVLLYSPCKVESTIHFQKECQQLPFQISKAVSLDALDKTLLALLSDSGDLSYNALAAHAKTTPDIAFYRIKKLVKLGVIRRFVPIVDLEKLGYQRYIIHFKFSDINPEIFRKLELFFLKNNNIYLAFRTAGELGAVVFCAYPSNKELDSFLSSMNSSFGSVMREQEIFLVSEVLAFNYFPNGLRV